MDSLQKPASYNADELHRLISAWCDEAISDVDFRRLQTILLGSEQARCDFISYMGVHGGIKTGIIGKDNLESFIPLPAEIPSSPLGGPVQSTGHILPFQSLFGLPWTKLAWVAVLFVALVGGSLAWNLLTAGSPSAPGPSGQRLANLQPDSSQPSSETSTVLARVSEQSPDCQWYFDRSGKVPTDMVRGGDTVRVTSGMMKLLFQNGTLVTLHAQRAPVVFEVLSEMRAYVVLGKVTAKIGPNAKGFSVITPQATVVDLGTEFGIDANAVGATDVVVFKGAVNVDYPATLVGTARQQKLRTGEAVHLDASGTASRIVSITNGQFSDQPAAESMRPPIITAVRDNIQRESAWNYYEIVYGGMAEDAKAFVDREYHEWNGVTPAGMPSYLLGGDYVKTFNNDKVRQDIAITLTVARPCRLYILFDDRIPPPSWLKAEFRNTGDKIGVDEGPYIINGKLRTDHQPGVGPGVSIDNIDSIWECDVSAPGSITLGGTETPKNAINMYGIVAVPLDEND